MRGPKLPCLQPPLDLVLIFIILNMIPGGGLVFIFRPCIPVRVGLFYWKPCSYIPAWHFLTLFVSGDSWLLLRGRDGPSLESKSMVDACFRHLCHFLGHTWKKKKYTSHKHKRKKYTSNVLCRYHLMSWTYVGNKDHTHHKSTNINLKVRKKWEWE